MRPPSYHCEFFRENEPSIHVKGMRALIFLGWESFREAESPSHLKNDFVRMKLHPITKGTFVLSFPSFFYFFSFEFKSNQINANRFNYMNTFEITWKTKDMCMKIQLIQIYVLTSWCRVLIPFIMSSFSLRFSFSYCFTCFILNFKRNRINIKVLKSLTIFERTSKTKNV